MNETNDPNGPSLWNALKFLALVTVVLAGFFYLEGCTTTGSHNTTSPTTIITTTTTTTTGPTLTPTPGQLACVPQTAPYVCTKASPLFGTILDAVQSGVQIAPEPIYVAALVAALNKDPSICAQAGPTSDEVTIKARVSNAISERWDVVRADGAAQALYISACSPASF